MLPQAPWCSLGGFSTRLKPALWLHLRVLEHFCFFLCTPKVLLKHLQDTSKATLRPSEGLLRFSSGLWRNSEAPLSALGASEASPGHWSLNALQTSKASPKHPEGSPQAPLTVPGMSEALVTHLCGSSRYLWGTSQALLKHFCNTFQT